MNKNHSVFLYLIIALCACVACSEGSANFIVYDDIAEMRGVIDETTPAEVKRLISDSPNLSVILMYNVTGSKDYGANLESARLIRESGITTYVPSDGFIASGGIDFFLAGAERTAEEGAQLGVHSWAGGGIENAQYLPQDHPEHQQYLDYYEEMGIPADFYWFTLEAASHNDAHFMTAEEIELYGLVTN